MYNRYVPTQEGGYRRQPMEEPERSPCPPPPQDCPEQQLCQESCQRECQQECPQESQPACPQTCPRQKQQQPLLGGLDLGDLLLLCVILLIVLESDGQDRLPLLIAAAAFLL